MKIEIKPASSLTGPWTERQAKRFFLKAARRCGVLRDTCRGIRSGALGYGLREDDPLSIHLMEAASLLDAVVSASARRAV